MEQCCEELERVGEHPTDSLLIGLVHMQRLVLQTGRLASRATATSGQYILDIPRNMLFSELHKELDRIIGGLPETLESNRGWPRCLIRVTANVLDLIWSHYHTVLVRLHEPTIYMNPPAISEGSLMKSQSLWICLKSAKSIFELMASVPVEKLTTLACSWVAHQGLANVTLTRLLFLDDPCWDTATARTFVNFPELIERLAEHFEASDRLGGPRRKTNQNGTSLQLLYAGRYRWAKGWYLSKLPLDSSTSATVGEQPSMSYTGIIDDTYWQMLFDPTLVDGLL